MWPLEEIPWLSSSVSHHPQGPKSWPKERLSKRLWVKEAEEMSQQKKDKIHTTIRRKIKTRRKKEIKKIILC
mgnify:CR=1 FL=1